MYECIHSTCNMLFFVTPFLTYEIALYVFSYMKIHKSMYVHIVEAYPSASEYLIICMTKLSIHVYTYRHTHRYIQMDIYLCVHVCV